MTGNNFWHEAVPLEHGERPALAGERNADVVIVGAGFTGLWTAYYLKRLSPALDVAVLETEHVGFGASGRNGGWVIPGIAGLGRYIGELDFDQRRHCCDVLSANVDDIGSALQKEGIEADFHKGGMIA